MSDEQAIWMRCPYDPAICGADATLSHVNADASGWTGLLTCANGHKFVVSQTPEEDPEWTTP
jgi:hypothetical protein